MGATAPSSCATTSTRTRFAVRVRSADGFERDAEVLRHLGRDPLVPDELLPRHWPGAELRERFVAFDARYRAMLRDAHRSVAAAAAV